jgi:hypothetical protein
MNPFPDTDTSSLKLSSSNDRHAHRMVDTFSAFIEGLDTTTLDYLRTMFVRGGSCDAQQAELLDVLDGERMLRTSDLR